MKQLDMDITHSNLWFDNRPTGLATQLVQIALSDRMSL
jgi:hypothetical protein